MTQTAETVTPLALKAASGAQYGGAALAVGSGAKTYLGFSPDEWTVIAMIVGAAVAVLGLICTQAMNWFFGMQRLKLAREKAVKEFYDDE
jgi:sarcosine oxidase gamma subunit